MRIKNISDTVLETLLYKTMESGGQKVVDCALPIILGEAIGLPKSLDALIITSDLQGVVMQRNHPILLGESLAEFLPVLIEADLGIRPSHIGIILCGDLFASLDQRGGHGDVRNVWSIFNKYFKWVAGIAGNHDTFGDNREFEEFKSTQGINYIDNEIKDIDGLNIAGISGIIGKAGRLNRVEREVYISSLRKLISKKPNILLLHQTPALSKNNLQGDEDIYNIIQGNSLDLTICGHSHWEKAIIELDNGTQVLNVDSRVIILLNDSDINRTVICNDK